MRYVINVMRSLIASRHFRMHQIVFVKGCGPGLIIKQSGIVRRHCFVHTYNPSRWVNTPCYLLREVTDEELEQYFQSASEHRLRHPEFVGAAAFDGGGKAVGAIN